MHFRISQNKMWKTWKLQNPLQVITLLRIMIELLPPSLTMLQGSTTFSHFPLFFSKRLADCLAANQTALLHIKHFCVSICFSYLFAFCRGSKKLMFLFSPILIYGFWQMWLPFQVVILRNKVLYLRCPSTLCQLLWVHWEFSRSYYTIVFII